MWAWGTYRDASGVMGFSKHTRIQVRSGVYIWLLCSPAIWCSKPSMLYVHPSPRQRIAHPCAEPRRLRSSSPSLLFLAPQLTPTCVYEPKRPEDQILRIASGACTHLHA